MTRPSRKPGAPRPPRLADALLEIFFNTYEVEDIQGDLYEVFERRLAAYGPRKARQLYWRDVLRFLNPLAAQRKISPPFPSPNAFAMIRNYLKTALRTLRRDKTYAGLNVTGLALGLAGGLLIFLFVRFHLGTDAFHPHADRIYRVVLDIHSQDGSVEREPGSAAPMGEALRKEFPQVEGTGLLMYFNGVPTLSPRRPGRPPEKFVETGGVAYGTRGLFDLFAFRFTAGNPATALDGPGKVVLTERQARKYFGTTQVLGRTIGLNNTTDLTVTGVVKDQRPDTDLKVDVLLSLPTLKIIQPAFELDNPGWVASNYWTFVRLPEGYDFRRLEAQLPAFREKYQGAGNRHWHYHLQPLRAMHFDERYGGYLRKPVLAALGLVGVFLVAIACFNFVNLATAQSLRRSKEVGVRKVMGGTQRQLFWQFITETALLVGLATLLAAGLAAGLLPWLNDWLDVPLSLDVRTHPDVLLFLAGLAAGVTFLAGSYPALVLAGYNPVLALKSKITMPRAGGVSLRRVLVAGQLALSQAFIIGALVVMHQMQYFRSADPGFRRQAIVLLRTGKTDRTKPQVREQLLGLAEVEEASFQVYPPMINNTDGGYVRFDRRQKFEPFLARDRWGDDRYLSLYGLQLVAGRNFVERDSVTEFIVNEEMVRRLGIADPADILGRHLFNDNAQVEGTIVGVVKNFHHKSLHNALEPVVIYSFPRIHGRVGIRLRTTDLSAALRKIEAVWRQAYPDQVFRYEFLDDSLAKLYAKEETIFRLTQLFTGVAVFICCLGFYGLVLFMAHRRTKEIGIRKVLGATLADILLLFGREFFGLVLVSFVVAAPLAGWVMRGWLAGFAYRVPVGWGIFALTGLLTVGIVLLTAGYRSLRAALADPVKSLRSE
ncbi:MAG: Acidobacterial duplicated orphan permease (function unknown) [uncultured Cytophagales bacterium]|uniref:ABC transporter, fused permease protein n=1 Tax=uncultured Cytophagales bacterium TaxID=158755 RepID=A0A6J4HPD9_9SPHI|nr:MAG: Acidobacterial duplicated orphan permease (function unknown) [uncultured Cytophagales bacterium]